MTAFHIANRAVGPSHPCFVIAEIGVNHNGSLDLATQLIDQAAACGADAVKFQTWKKGEQVGKYALKANYMDETTNAQDTVVGVIDKLCLDFSAFVHLKAHAESRGLIFLSTPDGYESLNFLVDGLKVPVIKIGSTEVTHPQFLSAIAAKRIPTILSTGTATLGEVESALVPFAGHDRVIVLHCTSEYPAPPDEVNLRAMTTLRSAFSRPVGLSDHSEGPEAAIAAVALGAVLVEKHFTLDKSMEGPDHRASATPAEFTDLVQAIRKTSLLLGTGVKAPTPSELRNLTAIRRSVVITRPIASGTVLTADLLACKRPGTGITPALLDAVIGMRVNRAMDEDEPLTWDDFK